TPRPAGRGPRRGGRSSRRCPPTRPPGWRRASSPPQRGRGERVDGVARAALHQPPDAVVAVEVAAERPPVVWRAHERRRPGGKGLERRRPERRALLDDHV